MLDTLQEDRFASALGRNKYWLCRWWPWLLQVPPDTLRTWKWSPTPKGTCPFRHLEDLEVVPHPPKMTFREC